MVPPCCVNALKSGSSSDMEMPEKSTSVTTCAFIGRSPNLAFVTFAAKAAADNASVKRNAMRFIVPSLPVP